MRLRLVLCAATLAVAAGACGSDDTATVVESAGIEAVTPAVTDPPDEVDVEAGATAGSATGDNASSSSALAGPGDVPDVDMIDVHTGNTVNLQAAVTGETPLLLWFWAPH